MNFNEAFDEAEYFCERGRLNPEVSHTFDGIPNDTNLRLACKSIQSKIPLSVSPAFVREQLTRTQPDPQRYIIDAPLGMKMLRGLVASCRLTLRELVAIACEADPNVHAIYGKSWLVRVPYSPVATQPLFQANEVNDRFDTVIRLCSACAKTRWKRTNERRAKWSKT